MKYNAISFSHNEQEFTVEPSPSDKGWVVVASVFVDGQPFPIAKYGVTYETQVDASMQYQGFDIVESLIQLARQDIEQNNVLLK